MPVSNPIIMLAIRENMFKNRPIGNIGAFAGQYFLTG
jgi:hypothetical protein